MDRPEFTKAMLDNVLTNLYREKSTPTVMMISPYARDGLVIVNRSVEEGWDWRRVKRELRRIRPRNRPTRRREYHRTALDTRRKIRV